MPRSRGYSIRTVIAAHMPTANAYGLLFVVWQCVRWSQFQRQLAVWIECSGQKWTRTHTHTNYDHHGKVATGTDAADSEVMDRNNNSRHRTTATDSKNLTNYYLYAKMLWTNAGTVERVVEVPGLVRYAWTAQLQLFHINYFTNFITRDAVSSIAERVLTQPVKWQWDRCSCSPRLGPELNMINKNLSHNKWNGSTDCDRSGREQRMRCNFARMPTHNSGPDAQGRRRMGDPIDIYILHSP